MAGSCKAMPRVSSVVATSPARTQLEAATAGRKRRCFQIQGWKVHSNAPTR